MTESTDTLVTLTFENTPNPSARKVIVSEPVHIGKAITYRRESGALGGGPLIEAILSLPSVTDLFLRDHVMTITQDGTGSWYVIEETLRTIFRDLFAHHDPTYTPPEPETRNVDVQRPKVIPSPQLDIIREILDETITPYIESHGGILDLVSFDTETHRLTIFYDGACGTCPSSMGMTLAAVQNLLRDQYDPTITVAVANPPSESGYF